jgi:hypothetical protein
MRLGLITLISICLGAVELRLTGPRQLEVIDGDRRAVVEIAPPEIHTESGERYERLPEFNFKTTAGWTKGQRLAGVIAAECTVQGALDPTSLVVRQGGTIFEKGRDYEADLAAGTVGRIPGGRIGENQPVEIQYRFVKQRIDTIVAEADGRISVRKGAAHVALPEAPAVGPGEWRLANVHVHGFGDLLTEEALYPVLEYAFPGTAGPPAAAEQLPKAWARLRNGEPLRILAWGDSVTTYGRYQTMFVERLRKQFPAARIELVTEAWGGRNTGSYLKEPPGSPHNYREKVLGARADLIVSEFVNDAGLTEAQVEERYAQLLADFRGIGAEWIILTPHYIRLDWMGLTRQKEIDEDPRPYVRGLRLFAAKHGVALADGSRRYGRLWRQGIPFLTLMENNINHPNVFGHSLFADALMALFQ